MDAHEFIISKANCIRFADKNGLKRTFDNTLSSEEILFRAPVPVFSQKWFIKDTIPLQVKSGLSASPVLTKFVVGSPSGTIITEAGITTYPDYKIYDYLISVPNHERFYLEVESSYNTFRSECIEIIDDDEDYLLFQWANTKKITNSFEYDYTTSTALGNAPFLRMKAEMIEYKLSGESEVYDNQAQKERLKSNLYRNLTLKTDIAPTAVLEILSIAMSHDLFLVNQVGYVSTELPEFTMIGSQAQISVGLTTKLSLGLNTSDIGFDCDTTNDSNVKNLKLSDLTGSGSVVATAGHTINQIILELKTGASGTVKVGYTVGGDELVRAYTLTTAKPFILLDRESIQQAGMTADYTIYVEASGTGFSADIYIQTINILP